MESIFLVYATACRFLALVELTNIVGSIQHPQHETIIYEANGF